MEEELELRDIWKVILKRWVMVLLIPLFAVLISAVASFYLLPPRYEASTTLLVLHPAPETGQEFYTRSSDLQLSRQLVTTYGEIAKSRRVAEATIAMAEGQYPLTTTQLRENIEVGLVKDTELIHITVSHHDPYGAAYWATLVTRAFMEEVGMIMRVENINILDEALAPPSPSSPRPYLNMAVALVLGVMLALFLAFLLEYLDDTIKLPEDVAASLGLPVLSAIPDFTKGSKT